MRPAIFVSSTCYDLGQVREDLRSFIEQLGYEPLLSEYPSFPIDPSLDTIENCRRRVAQNADILILVVGARYGSREPASGKSVTNIEYLAARAKGIPIFAFTEQSLDPIIRVWKANPNADFSAQVDTVDLLRFVDELRSTDRVWTTSFQRASQIIEVLRNQFAGLMLEGLSWRRQMLQYPAESYLRRLKGKSLQLALERPVGWEFLLLAQALSDEVETARHLREEHDEGFALELGEDPVNAMDWAGQRVAELQRTIGTLSSLFRMLGQRAVGAPGQPGDADAIAFLARSIGRVYVTALQWSRRVRTANLPNEFANLQQILARFTEDVLRDIEAYPARLRNIVGYGLSRPADSPQEKITAVLQVRLSDEVTKAFESELSRLAPRLRSR